LKAIYLTAIVFLLVACGMQAMEGRACAETAPFMVALSDDLNARASRAIDAGDYDGAIKILEDAFAETSFDDELKKLLALAHDTRGWKRVQAGDLDSALEDFRKAKLVEPEKQATTYMGLGYASFRQKDFDDALYYLFEVVYLDPKFSQAHALIGQIYYQRGKLRDAVTEWELALAGNPGDQEVKALLARANKELGVEGSFTKRETYYFNIKYDGEEKRQLGDKVLDIMNAAYSNVNGELGYYPREPINVILYTRKQFTDLTDAPAWSGGVFDGNIRVPVGGGNIDQTTLAAVLHHEYTHAVVHMIVGHGLPTWLDEGIAQYEEHWVRTPRQTISSNVLIPLSALSGSFMGIGDTAGAELAYSESLSAVNYYIDRFGIYSLTKMLKLMGEGKSLSDAMDDAAGVTLEDFEKLWESSVKGG